jgi:sigma-54 specific flagellar transcriptional regulator A
MRRVAERGGRSVELDATARAALTNHTWPGNVRELNHIIERATVLADGDTLSAADLRLSAGLPQLTVVPRASSEITVTHAPLPGDATVSEDDSTLDLRAAIEGLERRLIRQALERAQGNRTEAAALLGLNRTTLVEKLRRYG